MRATPMANRPKPAKPRASYCVHLPSAPWTTKATVLFAASSHHDEKTDTFPLPSQSDALTHNSCRGNAPQRFVHRHLHDGVLQCVQRRATPEVMRLRRSRVE